MKLKAQHVFDATLVVTKMIREQCPLPLKGKYRLARMHAKLLPEFQIIAARRDEMIVAFGYKAKVLALDGEVIEEAAEFSVPPDKTAEFNAAWAEIGAEEIEVDVEPIPLACLDLGDGIDSAIQASDLVTLGELVVE